MGLAPRDNQVGSAPSLIRQTAIYTVSQVASRAIPFLLLPIMTRYLTPADYGMVAMFLLVCVVLEPIIGLGLNGALTVKHYDDSIDLPRYFGTGLALALVAGLFVLAVAFITRDTLVAVTSVPATWLLLCIPLVFGRVIVAGLLALLRVQERAFSYGVFVNLQSAALFGLAILLVVGAGQSGEGRMTAEFVAWLAAALLALAWLRRSAMLRLEFDPAYAKDLLRFGTPLVPHALGAVLMVQSARLLLTNMVDVEETGIYTAGYQLAVVVLLAAEAFNNAYAPWLFRQLSDATDVVRQRLVRMTYQQFAVMTAVAVLSAVVLPPIAGAVLGRDYASAAQYVGWFALGFLFNAMYYMVANYIFFAQRTRWLALATFAVALVNLPLTFVLISINGGVGAAQAMAISYGMSFVLTWVISSRVYPMPWLDGLRSAR